MSIPGRQPIRLIVGLGNPGKAYEDTRHNIGFRVVESYAAEKGLKWKRSLRFRGLIAKHRFGDTNVLLLKPHTFMNASGRSVASAMKHLKANSSEVLCVYDEITLPTSVSKLSIQGSDGGHNGIKDILRLIGEGFARLRIGVGQKASPEVELKDHVLGAFSEEEADALNQQMNFYRNSIDLILREGPVLAMNTINKKKPNL
jgi:PTH1 family peptidyl-tRNA hydrolase